jgi:glycerol-3-phosphate dehydrogenase (NAD(P)+)
MSSKGRNAIGIVGRGRRAKSLARAAERHDQEVRMAALEDEAALSALAGASTLVLIGVGAQDLRAAMRRLSDHLDGSHVVVHCVRGLEPGSLEVPSRIVAEESCVRKVGALLGPALADEWAKEGPNAAVVASRFPEAIERTQAALAGAGLRVYSSKDLVGVETAGAAASIVAFACGICRELALGVTAEAMLITRAIAEVSRLCVAAGGEGKSAFGLAGLGDVLVQRDQETVSVRAGRLVARGTPRAEVTSQLGEVEVFDAISVFRALAERHNVTGRLTDITFDIVFESLPVADGVRRLMALSHLPE